MQHNELAPDLLKRLISGTAGSDEPNETAALIVLESVILGVLLYFRPNDLRAQTMFLETVTERVIERLGP